MFPKMSYASNTFREEDKFFALALWLTPGIGPQTFKKIAASFNSLKEVFDLSPEKLKNFGICPKDANWRKEALLRAEKEIAGLQKIKASFVTIFEEKYPALLKEIPNPPPVLFYQGSLPQEPGLAVVGSRAATSYGREVCRQWVSIFAKAGIPIISGFALGIDSIAHHAAVKQGSPTFAVLGCGLDINYPATNYHLREAVLANGGGLISEFPLGTLPHAGNFPVRNRIISGLSAAVLVVEASVKSGSLITARLAAEFGREVLAVPGSVFSPRSFGTHALIREGALLVDRPEQVLELFSASPLKQIVQQKLTFTEEEAKVLSCFDGEPLEFDDLLMQTGLPVAKLLEILTKLEIEGVVARQPGNTYQKVRL
ncbi:DNA-processing protein DprA [Thermodesulfatator atlanticus]|uniref:DNA-processing protein DprA n=1 Tax=Thermodesulfatator atlanticus TaxID=501497 RepID=UPI0003B40328|nr:DNA-processing protein DprA [Thermodesulfatator atlanticus]